MGIGGVDEDGVEASEDDGHVDGAQQYVDSFSASADGLGLGPGLTAALHDSLLCRRDRKSLADRGIQ